MLPKTATMSKQHTTVSKGRIFTINSFDIVAVFGNKVECCFEKVERCFDIVARVDGALAITEGPRDLLCHSTSFQLLHNCLKGLLYVNYRELYSELSEIARFDRLYNISY